MKTTTVVITICLGIFAASQAHVGNSNSPLNKFPSQSDKLILLKDDVMCACNKMYTPICGSDGVTYNNLCILKCHQKVTPDLKGVRFGRCEDQNLSEEPMCVCNKMMFPVCGSDGVTYNNPCLLKCQQKKNSTLTMVRYGICIGTVKAEEVPKFQPVCPELWAPVCGSDGKNYANMCLFKYSQSHESGLSVVHYGVCRQVQEEAALKFQPVCPELWAPVCGSDGKTYDNMCLFKYSQSHESGLSVVHYGVCGQVQEEAAPKFQPVCPALWAPVCGSDGKTYANMCLLKYSHESELTVAYQGVCHEDPICVCTREWNPVCGSDGKTYGNTCTFKCQQHEDNGLQVDHMGEC